MGFTVIRPGALSTIQDQGRKGYLKLGVSHCGAMDIEAMKIANALVGNNLDAPVLEVTLFGPEIQVDAVATVALVGWQLGWESATTAQFPATINDVPINFGETYSLMPKDRLSIGASRYGARCWVAFSGGIQVSKVLGSSATHVKTAMGGNRGRGLKAGDQLLLGDKGNWANFVGNRIRKSPLSHSESGDLFFRDLPSQEPFSVPLILGPHADRFTQESLKALVHSIYTLSPQCDRMGYRLQGETLNYREGEKPDILSEPNAVGGVQVPGDGQPLILLHDAGTTGGYAKIATIPTAYLRNLAQLKPGDQLSFVGIQVKEAQKNYFRLSGEVRQSIRQLQGYHAPAGTLMRVKLDSNYYQVFVDEL